MQKKYGITRIRSQEADSLVVAKFATTAADGKTYQTDHYNLDMIISVEYQAKSQRGVEFRMWANSVLKQYIIRGYDVRLRKNSIKKAICIFCKLQMLTDQLPSIVLI